MSKPHNHSHHHSTAKSGLMLAICLLFGFALVEAVSGWKANSMALLSDAGHSLTDGLSLLLAAFASWIASKPPSKKHSYGLGRAEVLGAWVSSLFMVLIAIFIGIEALERLKNPQPVVSPIVITVAIIGILLNVTLAWILSRTEQTLNMRAAVLHIIGDLLGSIAALISGIVIYLTGWMPIDPLLSCFIAILILISSFRLLKETLLVLMEGVPLHLDMHEVGNTMSKVEKITAIHDLHIWTLSSGRTVLTAHIELSDMHDWEVIFSQLRQLLIDDFGISHITLQPEIITRVIKISDVK
jgi:cobalt-zinc-cadmium efflux system protein